MKEIARFHWADYLVLGSFMIMSALIGVFIGFKDRKKMTADSFFTGGGNMHWAVVAFSMQASFLSSIFILSIPVEIYSWGSMYSYLCLAFFLGISFSGLFVLPVFYKLQLVSAYEYLEIRFNSVVRTACSLCFFLQIFLYMSVVLYTPALALAQVSGLSVSISIVVCGLVCTFYTVIGGMKATIWNDFIQIIIIGLTLLILLIFGMIKIGGFQRMWDISVRGGRIQFDDFRVDPRIRTTFWTQVIGGIFINLSMFASNQTSVQKYSGVSTLRGAKKSSVLCAVCISVLFVFVCTIGLESYAFYSECDPLIEGRIKKYDQIIPLFVMEVLGHLPGLPGLFMSAVFSAALSSLSGNLNALTAVSMTDFINPLHKKIKGVELDDRLRAMLSRGLTLLYGFLIIGMGFAAQFFGDVVVQVAFSIFGFVGGPLTCAIIGGMSLPFVNSTGTLCGLITSIIISSWVAVGSLFNKVPRPMLPMGDNCDLGNVTLVSQMAVSLVSNADESILANIYKISHMHYGFLTLCVYLLVSIPVSLITGRNKTVDKRLLIDWFDQCCCCLPSRWSWIFNCGTDVIDIEEMPEKVSQSVNSYINEIFNSSKEIKDSPYPSSTDLSSHDVPRKQGISTEESSLQDMDERDNKSLGVLNVMEPSEQIGSKDGKEGIDRNIVNKDIESNVKNLNIDSKSPKSLEAEATF